MASRRIASTEKTMLEKDDHHELSPPANEKSDTAPLVPTYVIVSLSHLDKIFRYVIHFIPSCADHIFHY